MSRLKLYTLVMMLTGISCSKEEKAGTATITVSPHLGETILITEPFTTCFDAIVTTTDSSMKVVSGHVYYTTDESAPTQETTTYVDIDPDQVTTNDDGSLALVSAEIPEVTASVTIKYLAVVQLSQQIEKESMGSKKSSEQLIYAQSEIGSVSYTWEGDIPPVEVDPTDSGTGTVDNTIIVTPVGTPTGTPVSIGLTAVSGGATPTAIKCFAILATALDASGNEIISDQDVTLTLTTLSGSGVFYSNGNCNSTVTSVTLVSGGSTKYLYYKDNTAETMSVKVVYAGVSSNTYTLVLGPPQIATILVTPSGTRSTCTRVGVSIKDSSGSYMFASVSQATTITLTKSSGGSSRFWTGAGCTGSNLTSGNVTTFTIPANSVSSDPMYFESAAADSWVFSGTWNSGAASGSGLTSYMDVFY